MTELRESLLQDLQYIASYVADTDQTPALEPIADAIMARFAIDRPAPVGSPSRLEDYRRRVAQQIASGQSLKNDELDRYLLDDRPAPVVDRPEPDNSYPWSGDNPPRVCDRFEGLPPAIGEAFSYALHDGHWGFADTLAPLVGWDGLLDQVRAETDHWTYGERARLYEGAEDETTEVGRRFAPVTYWMLGAPFDEDHPLYGWALGASPAPAPVVVKELEWQQVPDCETEHGYGLEDGLCYTVGPFQNGLAAKVWAAWLDDPDFGDLVEQGPYATLEAAKAACQADYTRRILSAVNAVSEARVAEFEAELAAPRPYIQERAAGVVNEILSSIQEGGK